MQALRHAVALALIGVGLSSAAEPPRPASLRVKWSSPVTGRAERVSLFPVDVHLPDGLTRSAAGELWTRPLDATEWSSLPSGTYRLVLRAGAAGDADVPPPVDVAEVVLGPGEDRTLQLRLPPPMQSRAGGNVEAGQRGAAAAVFRVRSAGDFELRPGVRVTAVRAHHLAAARGELPVSRLSMSSAVTNEEGWVRLANLPEEKVIFILEAPGRSRPQVSEPYAFRAGEETLVDDLFLNEPASIVVAVPLPEHIRDSLQLHAVELEPDQHNHWPRDAPIRELVVDGRAEVRDVPPGRWRVRATGRLKNGFAIRVGEESIEVHAGESRYVTLTITDTLFRGRVTYRGEPVKGSISLKHASDRQVRAAVAYVDADGTFHVLLQARGDYVVNIQQTDPRRGARLDRPVSFDDPRDEVAIELPEGEIRGRVVDSAGAPVKATVSAARTLDGGRAETGAPTLADGTFALDFVTPGVWHVAARTDHAASQPVIVTVDEGETDGVVLSVEPVATVALRVTDDTGAAVKNALVTVEFTAPDQSDARAMSETTRANGTAQFRLRPWQQKQRTNVYVATLPDGRLSCALVQLTGNPSVTISPLSGEVRLVRSRWRSTPGVRPWLVSDSGCSVPFLGARVEPDGSGAEAMVLRRLAAGRWAYVETRTPFELAALLTGDTASLNRLTSFEVKPGAVTRVVLTDR